MRGCMETCLGELLRVVLTASESMRYMHHELLIHDTYIYSIPLLQVGMSGGGAEDGEVLEDSRPPSYNYEWILIAAAIDRIAVLVFILTFFLFVA